MTWSRVILTGLFFRGGTRILRRAANPRRFTGRIPGRILGQILGRNEDPGELPALVMERMEPLEASPVYYWDPFCPGVGFTRSRPPSRAPPDLDFQGFCKTFGGFFDDFLL